MSFSKCFEDKKKGVRMLNLVSSPFSFHQIFFSSSELLVLDLNFSLEKSDAEQGEEGKEVCEHLSARLC